MRAVPSLPRIVRDTYRLERLLARGGIGAVYAARDVRADRPVAVKIVRADLLGDDDARQRFQRAAQTVAAIRHPSIVPVLDHGTLPDGSVFLVMELVRGEDLRHTLLREGRLEADRTVKILRDVCAGLDAAHAEGLVHRDLKPENILLPSSGVTATLLDFSLPSVVQDRRPQSGEIIGTPAYMAPEQLRGSVADTRSDIFSLGVIAFEMLTGELPFGRGSVAEIVVAQTRGVAATRRGLPRSLEHAVMAALQTDADDRPPTARAFAQLLAS